MKKRILGLALVMTLAISVFAGSAHAFTKSDWQTGDGTYGSISDVEGNSNAYLFKGADTYEESVNGFVGPYTKADIQQLADGITKEVTFKIDPAEIAQGEKFATSQALGNTSGERVTEFLVNFHKEADGSVSIVSGMDNAFTYKIKKAGIYTVCYEFSKTSEKIIGKFSLKEGETVLASTNDVDMVEASSHIDKNAKDATQSHYFWFVDISVAKGLRVYNTVPNNIYQPPVVTEDTELSTDNIKDVILAEGSSAKVEVQVSPDVKSLTLPKEALEAAKSENKALEVAVKNDAGKVAYTWVFNNSNITGDLNLIVNQKEAKDIAVIKDLAKDGLVLDFQHSGDLPTGTKVKMNVGTNYKANDKVKVSYFNEVTKKLEETKEYKVNDEGNVLMEITHCSKYVVEKVVEETPAPEEKPSTPEEKPSTPEKTPSVTEDKTPDTGDNSNVTLYATLMALSTMTALLFVAYKKRSRNN